MRPIILKGKAIRAGHEFAALIVPNTNDLLAVDERYPPDPDNGEPDSTWKITHIPTMYSVTRYGYTDASTLERAIEIAKRFFAEASARGWDLTSADHEEIIGKHNAMSADQKTKFWEAVRGSPRSEEAK